MTGAAVAALLSATSASAQISQGTTCDEAGIGAVTLTADAPVTILSATPAMATSGAISVPYCLVKVRIPTAINIWFGLPMDGTFNGRFQALGGGGYAGSIAAPTGAVVNGSRARSPIPATPAAVEQLRVVGTRGSEHATQGGLCVPIRTPDGGARQTACSSLLRSTCVALVLGRMFDGRSPRSAYDQDFPNDYDGVVAGAPAIHWDRFIAADLGRRSL